MTDHFRGATKKVRATTEESPVAGSRKISSKSRNADPINPQHYRQHPSGIEAIQVTESLNFCLGNAVKYIMRCDLKGDPITDLQKAAWYINREIERRQKAQR